MDFLIVYKWLHSWDDTAPSIITTMINLPLRMGKTADCCGGQPMWGYNYLTTSQNTLQFLILIISIICVPIMLCCKPLYIYLNNKKRLIDVKESFEADLQQVSIK
jgi:V-type H+-transporting ATPase subunit a